jgi:DNA-binding NarL/FixJ family response regulator
MKHSGKPVKLLIPYKSRCPKCGFPLFLTPMEITVLKFTADGKTSKEIATALNLSPKTIETHRISLMRKLEVNKTVLMVRWAIREGLIEA